MMHTYHIIVKTILAYIIIYLIFFVGIY